MPAARLILLGCLLALASGCSRAVYTELDIVVDAEGQRHEIKNYGRCTIFDRHFSILTVPRLAFTRDGSIPALRLPSGAGVVVALDLLDPCLRQLELLRYSLAAVTSRDPPLPPGSNSRFYQFFQPGSLLREGEIVSLNLRPYFTPRYLDQFVVWMDSAEEPKAMIGYLGNRLLDDATNKVRLVSASIRRMTPREWGDREPTRIEDIIPWEAKYCPLSKHRSLLKESNAWQWLAPVVSLVKLSDLPDGPWRQRLEAETAGLHPLPLDIEQDIPELHQTVIGPAVYSMVARTDDHFTLDTNALPPANVLLFHSMSDEHSAYAMSFPMTINGQRLVKQANGAYPTFYYDAPNKQLLRFSAAYFSPHFCSYYPKD
jgi:hypothetical protein